MGLRRVTRPKHCWVRFGHADLPGLLLDWRPKRERGGVSKWEGLVIYVDQALANGELTVTQRWVSGDLLRKAETR